MRCAACQWWASSAAGVAPARLGSALQRLGERQVQRGPLARQQVGIGGLLEQRVAEGVAVAVVDEHVMGDRLAQRLEQRGLRAAPRPWRAAGARPAARRPPPPAAPRARRARAPPAAGSGPRAGCAAAGRRRRRRRPAAPPRRTRCPRSAHAAARPARDRRRLRGSRATCVASSAGEKGSSSTRWTSSRRSSSARNGRSGWRRCSSSLR